MAAEAAQADAHVENCPPCQQFFAAEEGLEDFLRERAPLEKAPASLRERVLASIAQERERLGNRSRWFVFLRRRSITLSLVSLLIIGIAGGLWLNRRRAPVMPEQLTSVLIDDHVHSLPTGAEIASSNHNVVQSWFDGKVDFSFHLPPTSDQSLIGGRLCDLRGRQAALIFYQHPQSRVSLFVLDGSDVVLPEDRLISLDGKSCFMGSRKGYNAVLWKDRGVLYGLVSDARSADLLQLAAQF